MVARKAQGPGPQQPACTAPPPPQKTAILATLEGLAAIAPGADNPLLPAELCPSEVICEPVHF